MRTAFNRAIIAGSLVGMSACGLSPSPDFQSNEHSQEQRYESMRSQQVIIPEVLPSLDPAVKEKVLRAIVKIRGDSLYHQQKVIEGSGFKFENNLVDPNTKPEIITAGHVMEAIDPTGLTMVRYEGAGYFNPQGKIVSSRVDVDKGAYKDKKWLTESKRNEEDIAKFKIDDYGHVPALHPRDLDKLPLKPGEVVWFANFQNFREPRNPVIYPTIYLGKDSLRFGDFADNIDPNLMDDELQGGGSGGVAVDKHGDVVGVTDSSVNNHNLNSKCNNISNEIVWDDEAQELDSIDVKVGDTGECAEGVSTAQVRLVDRSGGFDIK